MNADNAGPFINLNGPADHALAGETFVPAASGDRKLLKGNDSWSSGAWHVRS
jgi:hypothetical protein